MKITVPVYVHAARGQFEVRPLFFPEPTAQAPKLERALHTFTRTVREKLHFVGKELRHDELARWCFNPDLDGKRLDVAIELRRRVAKCRLFLVMFEAFDRRVAFSPTFPELWFEVLRGQNLGERANEVFSEHFRTREREDGEAFVAPEEFKLEGAAWIHPQDLEINPAQKLENQDDLFRMMLGPAERVDGEHELLRVGRCLDHLYPDDLDRVLLRDAEIDELTRLLQASDRRPVLLLGPPQVGKTALVHEIVYRAMHARKDKHKMQDFTFLLAPQRLISGMSFVGQWENRLLAILKEARKKNHLLFFDDLLGLYHAGQTSQSDLSVAHVLKPYVERREVRLLAEMTPEMFRVLRERDRGFADLFHLLPLRAPDDAQTLRILIASQRRLEGRHRCRFAVDILPTVIDLQRRYARHQAFPGKAVQFLRGLAVKHHDAEITRAEVLREFHRQSGLALSFLDAHSKLERTQIVAALQARIIGQRPALDAAADIISIAKARLNDPERPLGACLFLGPTGVGKTQCAKAIAAYLFGDADHLLRFDMNEFVEPGSAARLVGTFYQPEGLLTSAVRRRPFAVVLLDEIEKAHPEVLDLLLQVLGEGRLTDAHGRLADFTNTIVILTSNLGVRESQTGFGFRQGDSVDPAIFVRAAERFFRPEFFNRLDRIVPFSRLTRDDVWKIAQGLIHDVLQREGLVRRKCLLQVEEVALERIVDKGFDPKFGARALKRAIERHLTQAVAARLAAGLPETFTHIHVYPAKDEIAVSVQGLTQVPVNPPPPDLSDVASILDKIKAANERIMKQFAPLRPRGAVTAKAREHYAYFTLQETADQLRNQLRRCRDAHEEAAQKSRRSSQGPEQVRKVRHKKSGTPTSRLLQEMAAAQDMHRFLKDLADSAAIWPSADDERLWPLDELVRQAAYLQMLADCVADGSPEQAIVHLRAANTGDVEWVRRLTRVVFPALFGGALGLELTELSNPKMIGREHSLLVKGLAAAPLARLEHGTHLCCPEHGGVATIQVMVWPVPHDAEPSAVLEAHQQVRHAWQARLQAGGASVDDDPFRLALVVRMHQANGKVVDLRSGQVYPSASQHWLLAALPLPAEFIDEEKT